MSYVKDILKGGAASALNQIKSYDIGGALKNSLSSAGINVDMPKLNLDTTKIDGKKIDLSKIQLPGGAENYISPITSKALSVVSVPSSINGVPIPELPKLPDLSSVSSQVDGYLLSHGLDTEKLGIRSVDDILETPDLASLKSVQWDSPATFDLLDLDSAIDKFDMAEAQKKIDSLSSLTDGKLKNFDISKYF